jgi:pyruvate dehydrogenase E1 component alpha subunit
MDAVMAEMFGKVAGCSRGRGGSMHLFDASRRFYGGNAIVGGGIPLAVGLALADAMRGRPVVTACFFGDGAVAEGEFHECLNLAALWRLPVLFCCENNLYAMGTRIDRAQASTDLTGRAASYGLSAVSVDGMDVLAVEAAAHAAVASVRAGHGPYFLELHTYRFRAHSMYDPDRYRDKAEIAQWKQRDPIEVLGARLREAGELTDADLAGLDATVAAEVDAAITAADAAAIEPVEDLTRFVVSPRPTEVRDA